MTKELRDVTGKKATGTARNAGSREGRPRVSIIIAASERPQDPAKLYAEYAPPLKRAFASIEFIFALEPYYHDLVASARDLAARGDPVRVLVPGQTVGETNLLNMAAAEANSEILLTLPPYHRVVADTLPDLVQRVLDGADVVVARRASPGETRWNRLQRRAYHSILRLVTGSELSDVASGVRAFRASVLRELRLYGDLGRFMPLVAAREGFRVEEVDAEQHPADQRSRLYRPGIYVRRLLDALSLFFLFRFLEKPLRFFGLVGVTATGVGAVLLLILGIQRIQGQPLADRPLLVLAVLFVILGVQSLALGLVGEIMVHLHAPERRPYRVAESTVEDRGGVERVGEGAGYPP